MGTRGKALDLLFQAEGGKMSGGISSNRLLKGYDSKDVFQGLSSFLMGDCNV